MLKWIVIFLVLALIAGLFGYTKISRGFERIARIIFFVFLVMLAVSLLFHIFN